MTANRIVVQKPETVHNVLQILESEWTQKSDQDRLRMIRTAVLRYLVPAWGGPEAPAGKRTSFEAFEFLKTVPTEKLITALRDLNYYSIQKQIKATCYSRNKCYLGQLVKIAEDRGWICCISNADRKPRFNQFNKPRGERRLSSADVKTTTRKRPSKYALGKFPEDFVEIEGQRFLANPTLDREFKEIKAYGLKLRKPKQVNHQIQHLQAIFGYLHRQVGIPKSELCLEILIPFVQLRFSERDFEGTELFAKTASGILIDPIKAEQTLAMSEAIAQRTAKTKSKITIDHLQGFFAYRQSELVKHGQPDGLEASTKRAVIDSAILAAKYRYHDQTDVEETDNFEDISVIRRLRLLQQKQEIERHKVQKQIQKRCISWERTIRIFEKVRQSSHSVHLDSRDRHRKSKMQTRQRKETSIATNVQKVVILGLMLFIPTDRQQTYRHLRFGQTLKNGFFKDASGQHFVDQGIPPTPNEAQLWINLEDFKTVKTYGEFWYPVPNIEFADGTTFYEHIAAWLWGFEDEKGTWSRYHKGDNSQWQGHIDAEGNRLGWRAALAPEHDYMFTMPSAKTPYYDNTFTSLIREIFIHYTQEDGEVVPVTPHSFRHMLSTYLSQLGISGQEEKSFSYVLHHSLETHQGCYVFRDNLTQINPAVQRMEQIIRTLL